jgi:hypothetical protein
VRTKREFSVWLITALLAVGCSTPDQMPKLTLECKDPAYGFTFMLPASWKGFSILHEGWDVKDSGESHVNAKGPTIIIRHPKWTVARQIVDIPVWVFTLKQWEERIPYHLVAGGDVLEVGRTDKYVFGVASRFSWPGMGDDDELDRIALDADMAVYQQSKSD